ncbi:ATP-dependent zinc metalloprotease FtsH [Isachenkonia alkalipeptolytica]|uniref:ATP-dependent zinc metalloprotease FtsH n=1 Tax=Isachenkonia alkalipeptolytica TaxID=2565777 RepID=A0AA43XLI9_9CLOT|nr:ATP-dependent zinc metalloprotease FtsH [Isachenkonia alkalipeptolytica]
MRGGLLLRKFFRGASFYILIFIVLLLIVQRWGMEAQEIEDIEFSELYQDLMNDQIVSINTQERSVDGVRLVNGEEQEFTSYIPDVYDDARFTEILTEKMDEADLTVGGEPPAETPWFINMLPTLLIILVFVVFWFVFMQQSQGGGSKVMNFGKSKAKLQKEEDRQKVTFDDVEGMDEEKEELSELVDFLKSPKRFIELGARIPKGVLMVGPPGTGKTYITKAVAGEAGVPFYSISGSDFVEMFVGVGASRVRDLFEQAKKSSPCIVFIDEIDAVGRKRGAGLGGGHDEREQTLNQLLVEMDGFGINEGIIIVAATNRPDILDPALLRPGRFDRKVEVGLPDIKGREAILHIHSKGKPLDDDVNVKVLARRTPGFTPADIENLMNEAALLTARRRAKRINMATIEEAITKVIAGIEKKSRVISEKERRITAYHEAGHAVAARCLPSSDPVHQITIVPRGRAGGFTMILPEEDKSYATKTEMEEHLIHLLGGRVAEKLKLDDISTGAQNDLQRVSQVTKAMVTKYGMSEKLGPMTFGSGDDEVFLGKDFASKRDYSEEVASRVDREIKRFVDGAYEAAIKILEEHSEQLEAVAQALLKKETINGFQFEKIFKGLVTVEEEDTADSLEKKLASIKIQAEIDSEKEEKEFKEQRKKDRQVEKNPKEIKEQEEKLQEIQREVREGHQQKESEESFKEGNREEDSAKEDSTTEEGPKEEAPKEQGEAREGSAEEHAKTDEDPKDSDDSEKESEEKKNQ